LLRLVGQKIILPIDLFYLPYPRRDSMVPDQGGNRATVDPLLSPQVVPMGPGLFVFFGPGGFLFFSNFVQYDGPPPPQALSTPPICVPNPTVLVSTSPEGYLFEGETPSRGSLCDYIGPLWGQRFFQTRPYNSVALGRVAYQDSERGLYWVLFARRVLLSQREGSFVFLIGIKIVYRPDCSQRPPSDATYPFVCPTPPGMLDPLPPGPPPFTQTSPEKFPLPLSCR